MTAHATYDPDADAIGVYFKREDSTYEASEEIAPGLTLDYDTEGRVIGLEILGVRQLLATRRLPPADAESEPSRPFSERLPT
jgi:uncharacterized protein YuzE